MRMFRHDDTVLDRRRDEPSNAADRPMGRAFLVGAGPGDPDLLTFRAARKIAEADVVLYDALVGADILLLAPPEALMIPVGKRCGRHSMAQADINRLIVAHARAGRRVVRLKGGDPFVFGRGGEELDALRDSGVPVEIVPGVTAACAAAASLAIPLTQRGVGRSLHFMSGHSMQPGPDAVDNDEDWSILARPGATLVLYMGAKRLAPITARMIVAGVTPTLPVVAVEKASARDERSCAGTVATIAETVAGAGFEGPTLLIFGEVTRSVSEGSAFSLQPDRASCGEVAGTVSGERFAGWSSFRAGGMAADVTRFASPSSPSQMP